MQSTPVHDHHNPELLNFIPSGSISLIEIGCSSGALARAYKTQLPGCHYLGVEVDAAYAELAKRYCDDCLVLDIESAPDSFWQDQSERDCWIFGDTLEHLKDPWTVLRRIRDVISRKGVVVACIPNAQHWTLQAKLSVGDFRYQESGLMDKTHLRWFTRQTIIELLDYAGFRIEAGVPRVMSNEPKTTREAVLAGIERMAEAMGADPKVAVADALPLQYVILARPIWP